MSSYTAGLTEDMPPAEMLAGPHGPLAFFAFPAAQPWLHVVVSHGFSEHSGWWGHVARTLRDRGVSTYLFDHYHHGRSAGEPGDVPDYAVLEDGLRWVLAQAVAPRLTGHPLVVLGHSNGALVTLLTLRGALPVPVAGVVLSSPFVAFPWRAAVGGTVLAWLLSRINPHWPVPLPNRPWRLTGLEQIWPGYSEDPLRFQHITARFFLAMRRALRVVRAVDTLGGRPLLLLTAGREVVVNGRAINPWYERLRDTERQRIHYPHLRHELFNERDWEPTVERVVAWCRERFARVGAAGGD